MDMQECLAKLHDLKVVHETVDHPCVMTSEAQVSRE
jgi:hypothetical protein